MGVLLVGSPKLTLVSIDGDCDVDERTRTPAEVLFRGGLDDCEKDANGFKRFSVLFICLWCQYIAAIITQQIQKIETPAPIITWVWIRRLFGCAEEEHCPLWQIELAINW